MFRIRKFVPLGAVAIACVTLAACGGDGEKLPADTARALLVDLSDARDQFDADDCARAGDVTASLNAQIDDLSNDVDPALRNALSTGSKNLARLIAESDVCIGGVPIEPPPITTDTTTTDTTTTDPTTTDTTTTDTTTTDTTTTDTTTTDTTTTDTTTTTPPPDDGGTGGTGGAGE